MKKPIFYLLALGALSFLSCSDDDSTPNTEEGKATIILATDMSASTSNSYIVPIKDLSVGTVSLKNAKEVYAGAYLERYKESIFYIPGISDATIKKYTRSEDGRLNEEGSLTLSSNSQSGVCNLLFLSDTKAYATLMVESKIVIFNPSTMQKTGEINLIKPEWNVNGSTTPTPMGMIYRDGYVYVGCPYFTSMPVSSNGAHIIIIDANNDAPVKMISDERGSTASGFNQGLFLDEKGDIYVTCWASYGYVSGQKSGFLRIKKGESEFDADYFFNLSEATVTGIEGNITYSMTNFYSKSGDAFIYGYCNAYASVPADWLNDKTMCTFKINMYTKSIEKLELPRSNSYSCSIQQYGNDILFGLSTTSNGVGLFTYNLETKAVSSSPVINIPGNVLDMVIFQ